MSEPQDSKDKSFKPVDRLRKKLTLDNLWLWILRLLLESNKYAYELRQEINDRFGFSPATVTSYAVLYRLERAGFVTEASTSKVPNRKYYEITSQGREALKEAEKTIRRALSELFDGLEDW